MKAAEIWIDVPSGRLHAQRFGPPDAPLGVFVPGITGNMRHGDFLGERIAGTDRQLVAVELRGRGVSDVTPPGTYGWEAHARDVLAVADVLGRPAFDWIGHSMGGFVGMTAARLAAHRIRRMVIIDALGLPDEAALAVVRTSMGRLGTVYSSPDEFLALLQQVGSVRPWSEYFERAYRYELVPAEGGGVIPRTDRGAILEDYEYGDRHYPGDWSMLTMPVLLVRATEDYLPGQGLIVRTEDRDRFFLEHPEAELLEVAANHMGVITSEATAAAIRSFLDRR